MGSYKIFCLVVFFIQAVIAGLSYGIGAKRVMIKRKYVDYLVGLSWTLTALWWLYCALTST